MGWLVEDGLKDHLVDMLLNVTEWLINVWVGVCVG